jgi:hypothetical protein
MKVKTLSLLAGLGAPLILTGSTDAGFLGVYVTGKPNPYGIGVCSVYARFDNPRQRQRPDDRGNAERHTDHQRGGRVVLEPPDVR